MMKICTKCKLNLSHNCFFKRANGKLHSWCKQCKYKSEKDKLSTDAEFANNKRIKDRLNRKRQWKDSPQVREKQRARQIKDNYGISVEDYETMLIKQCQQCAICGSASTKNKNQKFFSIDHDHKTGKVRELLCSKCNQGLGCFDHDKEILAKASAYMVKHEHKR